MRSPSPPYPHSFYPPCHFMDISLSPLDTPPLPFLAFFLTSVLIRPLPSPFFLLPLLLTRAVRFMSPLTVFPPLSSFSFFFILGCFFFPLFFQF